MASQKKATSKADKNQNTPDFRDAQSVKPGEIKLTNDFEKAPTDISSFYLDRCISLIMPLAEMIREGLLTLSPYSTQRMKGIFNFLKTKDGIKKLKKQDAVDLYSSFSSDLMNIIAVIKADRRYEKTWRSIVEQVTVSSVQIKELLGRRPTLQISYGWYGDSCVADILLFPLVTVEYWMEHGNRYDSSWYAGTFTLPATDRMQLADYLLGSDAIDGHLFKELPDEQKLKVENFEGDIATDIITMEGLALNGSLLTASGMITAPKLKKVRQQTEIRPFRPDSREWAIDRLEMLCFAYFNMLETDAKSKGNIDSAKLAKFSVEKIAGLLKGPNFGVFLPAYQGFTKAWSTENYARTIADCVDSILRLASKDWMSMDNFRMQLLCFPIGRTNIALRLFSPQGISRNQIIRKIDKEHETDRKWVVKKIDWFEEIGFSFAIHWIKFLCALGLVETAGPPETAPDDPLEGLRYVRLTALGRYALGLHKEYTPQNVHTNTGVEFDAQNGIITIDAKSPFQMFLGNVAKRISPTRFRISPETLLKGCRRKSELEQRVTNLRVIIDPDKEPAMRKIIDEAMSHTGCAEREGGYSLLRIRPDLPELREAILTNKELREMTILAGPTLALVKTHMMERFNTICASYGYLME